MRPVRLEFSSSSFHSGRCEIAGNQRSQAAHDDEARRGIALEHAQRRLAVDAQQRRFLEAARARDARRIAVEERGPAEHLALSEYEASRRDVLAPADEELHAPGVEHEEIDRKSVV